MARLLTVEDDPRIRESLVEAFVEEGHACDQAADVRTARLRLASAPWPGNVRQLENMIYRAVVLSEGDMLDAADFPHLGGANAAVPSEVPERFGLRLDLLRRRALLRGGLLDLTPKEFEFLTALLRADGGVVERGDLLREVWDLDDADSSNVLDVLVARLRRKLRARRGPTVFTERGVGYGLREEVER